MKPRFTCIALAVTSAVLALPALAAEEKKPAEGEASGIYGNPPPDSLFAKIKPGMKYEEATAILGKPDSVGAYCTGKHMIPFYFGNDKARTNQVFKGQGTIIFYSAASEWGIGRYKHCSPKEPTEVAEVHYDPNETGAAAPVPKEGEDAKKEPAAAAS